MLSATAPVRPDGVPDRREPQTRQPTGDPAPQRTRALVLTGAFAGLRIGELAGLQVGDFDPLRRQLRVRRTVSDISGRVVIGPPKTAKSIRTVSLPSSITKDLTDHIAERGATSSEDWIFPSPDGGPIRRTSWVRRFWKPGLAAAGLNKDLGTHTLRHSQVALLIAQGEHPKVIADRLGHTSVRTVLDVYGHLYEGADQAAAEALDKQIASYARPERVQHTVIELPQSRRNPR